MDIKAQINQLVTRISQDDQLKEQFQKEPVKALETVLGVDLPDDAIKGIIDGVKAKLAADQVSDVADKLKKLF